jgi:hypothetical protein
MASRSGGVAISTIDEIASSSRKARLLAMTRGLTANRKEDLFTKKETLALGPAPLSVYNIHS